jgi:hypothetical protein
LETKICRAIRPITRGKPAELSDQFGEENRQSYQTYLEKKTFRAIRPTWRGKPAELPELFGDENMQSYQTY